jgi:hypothetical protein
MQIKIKDKNAHLVSKLEFLVLYIGAIHFDVSLILGTGKLRTI